MNLETILNNTEFTKEELVYLLSLEGQDMQRLLDRALEVKLRELGNGVYLRGLIEFSNSCKKDCLYCGVRCSNKNIPRYTLTDQEVFDCAELAMEMQLGSLAIQSGERSDRVFADKIEYLVSEISRRYNNKLGITLSCGEQSEDVYRRWFNAGAHRYLLRIESSNTELYYKIHPRNQEHSYDVRINGIETLKKVGYQTGSGVMIGLPFQSLEILADDLLFFKNTDLAMVGMGPFIPHDETPLYEYKNELLSDEMRMNLTLKMISCLRLLMPRINMVAATACQTIDKQGREKAILAGANIMMPNLTPLKYRENYLIYPNKQNVKDRPIDAKNSLHLKMEAINHEIKYNEWGDSKAFFDK
ncbi:MAG: [FeFe] hydrogenase H-cluster radical maturase HydE [Bacteroidetes bacterium]|nr:[FeFe] hydrogenase H-cluster radical maturase HydE [Bacteroidota bacterium]